VRLIKLLAQRDTLGLSYHDCILHFIHIYDDNDNNNNNNGTPNRMMNELYTCTLIIASC
jgi:hypothetical protein